MKRSAQAWFDQAIDINKAGFRIWGYDTKGKFACRLEVNAVGLAAFSGKKGGRQVASVTWEKLVETLIQGSR